jgi:hypothetical protein
MSYNYHLYKAREIADGYCLRYEQDPEDAERWLQEQLETQPDRIKRMSLDILESRGMK